MYMKREHGRFREGVDHSTDDSTSCECYLRNRSDIRTCRTPDNGGHPGGGEMQVEKVVYI